MKSCEIIFFEAYKLFRLTLCLNSYLLIGAFFFLKFNVISYNNNDTFRYMHIVFLGLSISNEIFIVGITNSVWKEKLNAKQWAPYDMTI